MRYGSYLNALRRKIVNFKGVGAKAMTLMVASICNFLRVG
jgi:hypothetical protein